MTLLITKPAHNLHPQRFTILQICIKGPSLVMFALVRNQWLVLLVCCAVLGMRCCGLDP